MGKASIAWFLADRPDEWNTSIYRVLTPSERLSEAGHSCYVTHVGALLSGAPSPETQRAIDESDVIVLERLLLKEIHPFIQEQRSRGKLVVATFDDHYGVIPGSVARTTWRGGKDAREGKGAILGEFKRGLRLVDKFIVPSRLLLEEFSAYNPHGEYVPNFLDDKIWKDVVPNRSPDTFVIGWGGTSLHDAPWKDSGIIPALGAICRKYPKVQVHIQPPFADVIELFKRHGVRYKTGEWQKASEWPKTIATFDVGIAPLAGRYDQYRSALKTQEFSMLGIPWVATDAPPYKDTRGGVLVDNRSRRGLTWGSALEKLITDRMWYNALAEEGRAWAMDMNTKCVETYERALGL